MFLLPFIAGVALGGLLNVIIYRLPRLWPVPDGAPSLIELNSDPTAPGRINLTPTEADLLPSVGGGRAR